MPDTPAQLPDIPVGTPVRFWPGIREGDGRTSRTRTAPQMFRDVDPVVCVEGFPGFMALTHVDVISEDEYAEAALRSAEPEPTTRTDGLRLPVRLADSVLGTIIDADGVFIGRAADREIGRAMVGALNAAPRAQDGEPGHWPVISRMRSGEWGVHCLACSTAAGDHVPRCLVRPDDWPPLVLQEAPHCDLMEAKAKDAARAQDGAQEAAGALRGAGAAPTPPERSAAESEPQELDFDELRPDDLIDIRIRGARFGEMHYPTDADGGILDASLFFLIGTLGDQHSVNVACEEVTITRHEPDAGAAPAPAERSETPSAPRVHYEIETRDEDSPPEAYGYLVIDEAATLEDARESLRPNDRGDRIVRVTRKVIQ